MQSRGSSSDEAQTHRRTENNRSCWRATCDPPAVKLGGRACEIQFEYISGGHIDENTQTCRISRWGLSYSLAFLARLIVQLIRLVEKTRRLLSDSKREFGSRM